MAEMREPSAAPPDTSRPLFWAVVASTAGMFTSVSIARLVLRAPTEDAFTDSDLLVLLAIEATMALSWVPLLRRRGWTARAITLPAAPRDVATGAGVAVAAYLAYWLSFVAVSAASPGFARAASEIRIGGDVSPWAAVLVSVANPIAEEFLYLGFVANVLRREGHAFALSASTVLRVCVHLYQGPLGVISNVPFGVVLAAYYLRSGRLWPAILAHGYMDFIALSRMVQ
jgi:uncharacterized protein